MKLYILFIFLRIGWSSLDPIRSVSELNEFLDRLDREAESSAVPSVKRSYGRFNEFRALAREMLSKNSALLTTDIVEEARHRGIDAPGKTARNLVWQVRNSLNIKSDYHEKKKMKIAT